MANNERKSRIGKLFDFILDKLSTTFIVLLGLLLLGLIIKYVWNYVCPDVFGLPCLTYWQAVSLGFLARLIFGFE